MSCAHNVVSKSCTNYLRNEGHFIMPCMYFSGEKKSEDITFDDPDHKFIGINPELYASVQLDKEQNARLFLGTHLLTIHSYTPENDLSIERVCR